jgi:hypothetical protein
VAENVDRRAVYLPPMVTLQVPQALPVESITLRRAPDRLRHDWLFGVVVEDHGQRAELRVSLSQTQCCLAGLREPTAGWINDRLQSLAKSRLSVDQPLIDQVRTWRQPIPLFAPPR